MDYVFQDGNILCMMDTQMDIVFMEEAREELILNLWEQRDTLIPKEALTTQQEDLVNEAYDDRK